MSYIINSSDYLYVERQYHTWWMPVDNWGGTIGIYSKLFTQRVV